MDPSSSFYHHTESTQSLLLATRGSERHIRVDQTGIYLSSLAVTILFSVLLTMVILLSTMALTYWMVANNCEHRQMLLQASAASKASELNRCASFRLNAELGNVQSWLLPSECENHVRDYMGGGQYLLDVELAANASMSYFRTLGSSSNGKDAVVFDIDETLLSNLPYYVDHHYGAEAFNKTSWDRWEQQCKAPVLDSMLSLYKQIQRANFSVILLTGRDEGHRSCTEKNLKAAGYTGFASLHLRGSRDQGLSALAYKSARRLKIQEQGYRIAASFGDQWSDIRGPATGNRTFKIPNPLYYIA